MQEYEFTVVMERDEDGRFIAICPGLQGCYTEGESEEEARELILDVANLHLQSLNIHSPNRRSGYGPQP